MSLASHNSCLNMTVIWFVYFAVFSFVPYLGDFVRELFVPLLCLWCDCCQLRGQDSAVGEGGILNIFKLQILDEQKTYLCQAPALGPPKLLNGFAQIPWPLPAQMGGPPTPRGLRQWLLQFSQLMIFSKTLLQVRRSVGVGWRFRRNEINKSTQAGAQSQGQPGSNEIRQF